MARPVDRTVVRLVLGEALDWLTVSALLALLAWAVAVGLAFMPITGFVQNREPLLLFEQGALAIGAGALLRWLLGGRALPGALLVALGATAALSLLSLAHTTDLYATREEIFFILAASMLVLAAAICITNAAKAYACVAGLVLLTLGEAIVGLGQWAGGAPTPAYWLSRTFAAIIRTRVYGTLGSPNVLAGFLLLGIAASALLAMSLPGLWRFLPAAALSAEVVALLLTYSRGGYVGLAAFAVASGAFLLPLRRRAWPVLILLLLITGAVAVLLPTIVLRAQSIAPAQEDTATSRFFIWRTALRMWGDHRVWGTGLGTFNAAYSPYRPPGVLATYAMLAIPGSAHDDYLQALVETGLVGVTLMGGAVAWGMWRAFRRYAGGGVEERTWLGAWGGGLVGIGATSLGDENLFVITNSVLLLLLTTAVAAHVSPDRPSLRLWQRLLALPLLALLIGLPPLLAPPVQANALHTLATLQVKSRQYAEAVRTFENALARDPLNGAIPAYFGDLLADLYTRHIDTPAGPWPTLRDQAVDLYVRATRLAPYDAYPWAELGRVRGFQERPGAAVAALHQAVLRDPYTPRYRVWLGQALVAAGDRREAIAQLREALRLYPVELLVIAHHEGEGQRYSAALAAFADARELLEKLERRP